GNYSLRDGTKVEAGGKSKGDEEKGQGEESAGDEDKEKKLNLAATISTQSRTGIVLVSLLCAAGIYAALKLPIPIFPPASFPRIVIVVDDGEAPATQVLVSVTRPIEEAMNGIPGVNRIRSKTERGATEIDLFFNWNVDVLQSLQLVQARLSQLTSS